VKRAFTLTFFSFLLIFTSAIGQEAMEKFGKNRVQYKNFKWRYYSTENFDIYFYDGGNEIATIATGYLEKEFDRITDLLGSVSYSKTEIFLYNSPTDLLQSNIGVNDNSFDVAGQTDFVKPMVEIAYPGNAEEFKKELIFKISSMLIYDMMFGGSFSDMFQNSYLLMLPEWYMTGAARYAAYGWDTKMDDFIRDLIRNKGLKNVTKYTGDKAELIGQSIWNFIAEKYGVSYISNILNLTRIIRNEERSISGTLGVPYKSFLTEWEMFYLEQTSFIDQNYKLPSQKSRKTLATRESNLTDVKISPEGNHYAYSANMNGKYKVIVGAMDRNKEKTALGGGYRLINQKPENNLPLLSWRDENTLAIITTKYGRYYMVMYDLSSGKKVRKELTTINQVCDFDILKNGNLAVISADRNGDSDLYLISLKRNSIKRITTDFFDDINPRFIPGTSSIIFSSNRTTDSIDVKGRDIGKISDTYNIFIYNIDTTKNTVFRVTNTLSKNTMPVPVNDNEYYYISEQQGIANLFKYDYSKKIAHQVSDFGSGIKDYDISADKRYFSFIMGDNGRDNLYIDDSYNLDNSIFTAQTKRQQFLSAKMVAQRLKAARERKAMDAINTEILPDSARTITSAPKTMEPQKSSSFLDSYNQNIKSDPAAENIIDLDNYSFADAQPTTPAIEKKPANDLVDTDGYVFDTDVVKSSRNTGSVLSAYRRLRKESDVAGPYDYQTQFSADNIVTSFVIDPMIGFGLKLEAQMNDQLENHKFYGGVLIPTDLKSGSFYGEYRYLKYTVDFAARYSRKSLYRNVDESNSEQRYILNTYEVSASLPLNVKSRLSIVPFIETTKFWDLDYTYVIYPTSGPVNSVVNYGGVKFEYIYDNTVVGGLNLIQGTRGKIGLKHNEGVSDNSKSFSNFYMDLRHYQKLHKDLIVATRLFYGRYWGNNPQKYLLGGMDNWLFNSTNNTGLNDPLDCQLGVDNSNILFVEYVTSLRGFDYNTFNGENSLLFNAELRLPFVKYLANGPVTSNFLRNLQFIGFYDIGSAWTGSSPFATENSVNTEILAPPGSPFKARIQNYKNPWLQSYGFGARTIFLGYYLKFDIAYPIEDFVKGKTQYLVTLGYDF